MIRLQFFGNFSLIDQVCIGEDNCSKDVTRLKKILENENDKKKKKNSVGGSSLPFSQKNKKIEKLGGNRHSITYSERN